jgi:uncharacterized iron-regulated membrane protein
MATLLFTVGLLVAVVSGVVLAIIARMRIRAWRRVRAHGVAEPVDRDGALIIGAWIAGLILGVSLILLS